MNRPCSGSASDESIKLLALARLLEYPTAETSIQAQLPLVELEHHYISLFVNRIGGVPAPPYAGCYLPDINRIEFMQEIGGEARQLGISLSSAQPPDYIPMMIEFLCFAQASSNFSDVQKEKFFRTYFSTWPELFAERISAHDRYGFYTDVGVTLAEVLHR